MAFQQTTSKSDSLETKLDEVEKILGRLSFGVGKEAIAILDTLDKVFLRITSLNQQGSTPKAELAQFETVCADLRKDGREFLKQIGGAAVLKAKREAIQPPRDHWWWYLDEELATAQHKNLMRSLRTAGIALVVFVIAAIIYQVFFSPDPLVIAEVDAQQNADLYLTQGDMDKALSYIEIGLTKVPESADLLIYKATILQAMGKTAEAEPIFAKARQLKNDQEVFVLTQSQVLNMMNKPQEAINLLQDLIKEYPSSAKAYLMLGQSYETMGDQLNALAAYETASSLGEESGDSTTTAQARIKMGMLMQVYGMGQPSLSPQVTATP